MRFRVAVVVDFVFRGLGLSRSTDVDIEAETPLTRDMIDRTVESLVAQMTTAGSSDQWTQIQGAKDYSYEIQAVFRDLGGG